ncbi:MAG TPA: NAD(P)-dependent oxidoreductase [Patescibacteria group bacterium]|nr:NAD(P)-dependent oxidoreductase [Patescibacteria group bacterium]
MKKKVSQIKTVLVTGGGGFIGSHLLKMLLAKNYKVIVLERSVNDIVRIKGLLNKIKIYYSNDDPEKIFHENDIDALIHLATLYLKEHNCPEQAKSLIDVNIGFTTVLAELCSKHKVRCFINTGTFFEYELTDKKISETSNKAPYNLYAATKTAAAQILRYYSLGKGLKVINLYLFAPFGDGDNEKLMALLVRALVDNTLLDFSGGDQRWNFTYVKDITAAYVCALEKADKINNYENFNVGYDKVYSIKEIAKKLEKISGKKLKVNWGAKSYVDNEIFYVNADNTKLRRALGWKPKYDVDSGLRQTYEYFSNKYGSKNAR